MVQTLPCGSLFWNINIAWLSMHNSICLWTVQSNVFVFAVRLRTQKARPLRKKSWSKLSLSVLLLALLRAFPQYQVILLSKHSWKLEKYYPYFKRGHRLLAKVRRIKAKQKTPQLLSTALIPCSPLRPSFPLSVPWDELPSCGNKPAPISQTQVKCSKSRNQTRDLLANFSTAASLAVEVMAVFANDSLVLVKHWRRMPWTSPHNSHLFQRKFYWCKTIWGIP